jgi:DNA repair protein RadA/Sms
VKCKECHHELDPGKVQCRRCGTWNIKVAVPLSKYVIRLTDAKLGVVERIETGLVDLVFGGGIVVTSVTLLGGEPGAGKTTLCLQLASIFTTKFKPHNGIVLYIANEQDGSEIRSTAERLILPNADNIYIVNAMGGVDFDIADLLLQYKPCLVILDSLTKWSGDDPALAVFIAQRLKEYAVKLKCPMIAISQVTKDDDYAGLNKLKHEVDLLAMFDILEGELDERGQPIPKNLSPRRLMSTKNRNGPAPEEQFFQMTELGLVPFEVQPLE